MTKVLHVVQTLKGGGAETLVRDMVPRMSARGFDVAVASLYPSKLDAQEKLALRCQVHELNRRNRTDFRAPLRLMHLMRELRPDIVNTHVTTGKYWGRACAILSGVPTIIHTEHSPDPKLEFWEWPASLLLNPRTDVIVTFSERTATFIRRREHVRRLYIIPNGIEIPEPPNHMQREEARANLTAGELTIIGVVASLYPLKNQALALRSFALLPERVKGVARLDLFGSGPLEGELRALARDLGIQTHVMFHGFRSDMRALLPGLDMFLSVALVEAAPISFLEAMSAKLPIIATPSIGALDMVEGNVTGLIARSWDPEDVAHQLDKALSNPEWVRRAGDNARTRLIQNFNIESTVDKYLDLYNRLLAARQPHSRSSGDTFS